MPITAALANASNLIGSSFVRFGNLWIPGERLADIVQHTVGRIVWEHEGVIGLSGTATLVRRGSKNWMIACRHSVDLKSADLSESAVLDTVHVCKNRNGFLDNIGFTAARTISVHGDEELSDLFALEADLPASNMSHEGYAFKELPLIPPEVGVPSLLVGCPRVRNIDYDGELPSVVITTAVQDCFVDPLFLPSKHKLARFTFANRDLQMDGMSGGAVYSLFRDGANLGVGLTGIIVRGGRGNAYVVPSVSLSRLLSS